MCCVVCGYMCGVMRMVYVEVCGVCVWSMCVYVWSMCVLCGVRVICTFVCIYVYMCSVYLHMHVYIHLLS